MNQTTSPSVANLPRNDWTDTLRGWAILAVIALHINMRLPLQLSGLGAAIPKRLFSFLFSSGYQAVSVFFVISGFLIARLTIERYGSLAHMQPGDFYRKRMARLMPCLLLFIMVESALQLAQCGPFVSHVSPTSLPRTIVAALGFHLNWLEARDGYLPGGWDVLWSLSVEEMFYLCFPMMCLLLRRPRYIVPVSLLLLAMGPFARTQWTQNDIWADHSYLSCFGEISLGCIAALLAQRWRPAAPTAWVLMVAGVGLMSIPLYFRHIASVLGLFKSGLDITTLALGAALLLLAVAPYAEALAVLRRSWPVRLLSWFGRNSYEGYLVHMFVVLGGVALFKAWALPVVVLPAYFVALVLLSGLLAEALARFVSQPMNHWLRGEQRQGELRLAFVRG